MLRFFLKKSSVVLLLALANILQFLKQVWMASRLGPESYSLWIIVFFMIQLVYDFGGLGIHVFAAHKMALYHRRNK